MPTTRLHLISLLVLVILILLILMPLSAGLLRGPAFDIISMSEWLNQTSLNPIVLYPEPEELSLQLGPFYAEEVNYTEMSYISEWDPNSSGQTHNFFQSDSFAPFFGPDSLMKRFNSDRVDVLSKKYLLQLKQPNQQEIEVEVRLKENEPNSGITLFEIGGTHVVHNWQGTTEKQALSLIEQHATLITVDDVALIRELDRQLNERAEKAQAALKDSGG